METNPRQLSPSILNGRYSIRCDGSRRLTYASQVGVTTIELGPGYFARVSSRNTDSLREVTVSSAANSSAYVVTRVELRGQELVKSVRTEFLSKAIRLDEYTATAEEIRRSTHWQYPNGVQIDANYTADGRNLTIATRDATVGLSTTGQATGRVLQAVTQRTDGADDADGQVIIIGDKTIGPGKSATVIGVVQRNTAFQYSTVFTRPDGVIVASGVVPFENGVVAGQTTTDVTSPDNSSITSNAVATQQNGDGTTTVTVGNGRVDKDGIATSTGTASTTPGGGFSSYTEATQRNLNGEVTQGQRSSYSNDGAGNESQTTVTYNPDGSFTIDTTSKDADGNVTGGDPQTFDKDGNPIDHPEGGDGHGGNGEGGDGHGGNGEGGDGHGGGGEGGEYPADDGTDPSPRPFKRGPADGAFSQWLSASSPFLGGSLAFAFQPKNPGDPADLVNAAMEQDDEGAPPSLTPSSSGSGSISGTVDLRPLLPSDRDPENDPRALVAALATLAGLSHSGALNAAETAIRAL